MASVLFRLLTVLLCLPFIQSHRDSHNDLAIRQKHRSLTTSVLEKKVGLAWPNGNDPSLKFYKTDRTNYLYTWSPDCPSQSKELGFNCVPMLWGENQADHFKAIVVKGYADYVLGFNEQVKPLSVRSISRSARPNQEHQAEMSPQDAATLWKSHIQPLKALGYTLVSPAVTSAPSGKTWMQDFFRECDSCTFDALALHWYDVGADKFIRYVEDFHQTFNLPIWVTEFACQNFNDGPQCTQEEVFEFMTTVTAWMDQTVYVQAYFAFGLGHDMVNVNPLNQLMASSGRPTILGNMYIHA